MHQNNAIKSLAPPISFKVVLLCLAWYTCSALGNNLSKSVLTVLPLPITLTQVQFLSNMCGSLIYATINKNTAKLHLPSITLKPFLYCICFPLSLLKKIFSLIQPKGKTLGPSLLGVSNDNNNNSNNNLSVNVLGENNVTKDPMLSTILAECAPLALFQIFGHIFSHKATSMIAVSLVHTIKGLSPFFTVLISVVILKIRFSSGTYYALIPLTAGIIMACSSEAHAHPAGVLWALAGTLVFVMQNLYSKHLLTPDKSSTSSSLASSALKKNPVNVPANIALKAIRSPLETPNENTDEELSKSRNNSNSIDSDGSSYASYLSSRNSPTGYFDNNNSQSNLSPTQQLQQQQQQQIENITLNSSTPPPSSIPPSFQVSFEPCSTPPDRNDFLDTHFRTNFNSISSLSNNSSNNGTGNKSTVSYHRRRASSLSIQTKKIDKVTLLFYCSILAFLFTVPIWLYSEGLPITRKVSQEIMELFEMIFDYRFSTSTIEESSSSSKLLNSKFSLSKLKHSGSESLKSHSNLKDTSTITLDISVYVLLFELVLNGALHFGQSLLAFQILGMVSPVTYSIASLVKRIFVVLVAIVWFGQHVSGVQTVGIIFSFLGLYLYDRAGGVLKQRSVLPLSNKS